MTEQLIAVAMNKHGQLADHAGRALHWRVYVVTASDITFAWSLQLTEMGCLHEWHVRGDGNRHPLHYVDVALAGSAGEGVTRRLKERDTVLLTTAESDPEAAIAAYRSDNLPAGLPHEECQHHT